MRFAYIDSNGNEVPIPSVDALALRIELGAISENTELYDAQADQWGPAHTHEIFHSLSRAAGGEEGFVAPAPVVPEPEPEPEAEPEPAAEIELALAEPEPIVEEAPSEPADLGLTLAEAPDLDLSLTEEEPAEAEASTEGDSDLGFGGLDLAPAPDPIDEGEGAAPLDLSEPDEADDASDEGASFDFGDMGAGLELEASPDEPVAEGAMDFSGGGMGLEVEGQEPAPDFSGGMELETEMEFDGGGFDGGGSGSLDLETPMSDFSPEAPPAWMEQDGPGGGSEEEVLDFSAAGAGSDADGAPGEVPLRDRRTPVNKPSKPKLRRQRNLAGPIVGIVVLLAVGIGGYVAWPLLSAQLFGPDVPDVPPVVIPDLAAELMPQMRSAADDAFAATFEDVRGEWATGNPVQSPSSDWLAGIYLANAGDFDNVQAFWDGMSVFLDGVRAIDLATFDAAYQNALQSAGVSEADGALMRARADSGFVGAAPVRAATFDKVEELITGALALHSFLVANQANIEYVPASNITTDPVLEANPSTPEIREAMEGQIDVVTRALADLGYMDLVTAEGLWGTVLQQMQEDGIQ